MRRDEECFYDAIDEAIDLNGTFENAGFNLRQTDILLSPNNNNNGRTCILRFRG